MWWFGLVVGGSGKWMFSHEVIWCRLLQKKMVASKKLFLIDCFNEEEFDAGFDGNLVVFSDCKKKQKKQNTLSNLL